MQRRREGFFSEEHSLKEILHGLGRVQNFLRTNQIPSLIGGGVALDTHVLMKKGIAFVRTHKDIDLLIPIANRGKLITLLPVLPFQYDLKAIHTNDISFMRIAFSGIDYDIFFTYGNEKHTFTSYPFIYRSNPLTRVKAPPDIEINPKPVKYIYESVEYDVLDVLSLHRIKEGFGLGNQSDIDMLKELNQ